MTTLDQLVAAKVALNVATAAYAAAVTEKTAAQLDYDTKHSDPTTSPGDLALAHDRLDQSVASLASAGLARDDAQTVYNTTKTSYEATNTPVDHDTAVANAKAKVAGAEADVAVKKATRDAKSNYLTALPASTSQADVAKAALELATANSALGISEQELETARAELANAEAAREQAQPISLDQAVVLATNAYSESVQNRVNAKVVLDAAKAVELDAAANRVAKQAVYDGLVAAVPNDPVATQVALDALNVARLGVADADALRIQAQSAYNAAVAAADMARATMKLAKEKIEQAQAAATADAAEQAQLAAAAQLIADAQAEAARILAEAQAAADALAAEAIDDAIDDVAVVDPVDTGSNAMTWLIAAAIVVAVAMGGMYFVKEQNARNQALQDSIEAIRAEQAQVPVVIEAPVVVEAPAPVPMPEPTPVVVIEPVVVIPTVEPVQSRPNPCRGNDEYRDGYCYPERPQYNYNQRSYGYSASIK